jgi:tetratricopeptide (TPR) repeat protein
MVTTKGHDEGLPIARVVTRGSRAEGAPLAPRRYLPDAATLVGRDPERRTIAAAAETALGGRPALLLVEGESGIGKSCMLQDLFSSWVEQGYVGFSAECTSGGAAAPLLAWRPLLLDLCGVDEGAPPRSQHAQLQRTLAGLPEAQRSTGPLLAQVLGIVRTGRDSLLQPEDEARLFGLVSALVARQVLHGPLLLMLEDVHWADQPSLRLVAELMRQLPPSAAYPLCIVLSHRPIDGAPPAPLAALRAHRTAVRVTVGRLSPHEIVAMIRGQLGVSAVHDELRQHVERHTEGQPLFIKEYLRVLRQHGLITVESDTARLVKSYVTVQISNSAQGIIQARVDRLDTATRQTLKVAAVLGRSFSLRLLSTIHPSHPSPEELAAQLKTLTELQIIDLELEDPERVYRFKYGITHEVAYTSLLFGQRRQLHSAVADWYECAHEAEIAAGTAPTAVYEVLIDHLGRAEQWERKARYCRIAAERAVKSFNTSAALRYVEHALVAIKEPRQHFNLLLLRVAVNDRVGNYTNQAEDLTQLRTLALQLPGPLPAAYADIFRLRFLLALGMMQTAATLAPQLERRLRRAERSASPTTRGELILLRAVCAECLGATRAALGAKGSARATIARALSLCWAAPESTTSALGVVTIMHPQSMAARCLDRLGELESAEGMYDLAMAYHQHALRLAQAGEDWTGEIRSRNAIGRVLLAQGEQASAIEEARAALSTSNAVGDRVGQATALQLMAAISKAQGDYPAAERDAHHALAISANVRARDLEARLWEDMATLAQAQGHEEEVSAARLEVERVRRLRWGPGMPAEAVVGAA